jgi:metal-responsive CopG/Arc/MetJ family transcriptional regulator
MERTTRQFTISLPPDLAEQVTAIAKAESRTISELFREAFRTYRAGRVRALLDASQEAGRRTRHMGYKPEDVERLIRETRRTAPAKKRRRR